MYGILATFTLGPGMRETADKLAEHWEPVLSSLKGFKSATMFGNAETGEYAALTLWKTKEDEEVAIVDTEAAFQRHVGNIAKEPPTRRIYEVWRTF
ncbi:MAG: hypothetical protein DRH24_13490 [Deltaproteobacteria bacterium]|nr:MAG: hypothetical protein DRH24_13490 [Deltaproteobacteria bacterium]